MTKQNKALTNSLTPEDVFTWQSPIGLLEIALIAHKVQRVSLLSQGKVSNPAPLTTLQEKIIHALDSYFHGQLPILDVPLDWNQGTEFQQKVWRALLQIPYGETRSYADIAHEVKNPKAVRAVGQAVGKNPWLILVPCHRVIASSGKLGGFSCGLDIKRQLLQIESQRMEVNL